MDPLATALLILVAALAVVAFLMQRARRRLEQAGLETKPKAVGVPAAEPGPDLDVVHPRPKVVDMHVVDDEARVTFDVALPEEPDEVLTELLLTEAVEVVREKRHTLPMSQVTKVVVYAGKGAPRRLAETTLDTPGELPPRPTVPSVLNLTTIAADPLEQQFEEPIGPLPGVEVPTGTDVLPPIGRELKLPKAVETGLRALGVDPDTMTAMDLVSGTLRLLGYRIEAGINPGTYLATKGGTRTFIMEDLYREDGHPELDESMIRRFIVEFGQSGADRGLLVSEKYAPFQIYDWERREPRCRFLTRERLQKLVDSLALG